MGDVEGDNCPKCDGAASQCNACDAGIMDCNCGPDAEPMTCEKCGGTGSNPYEPSYEEDRK